MKLLLSPKSLDDYKRFLKIKSLPKYRFVGRTAEFPDEYAGLLQMKVRSRSGSGYSPIEGLFDYQQDIAEMAIRKRKFAAFVRPGLGKTLIEYEFGRHAQENLPKIKCVLMIEPSMVIRKDEYYVACLKNLERAKRKSADDEITMFSQLEGSNK